MKKDIQKSTNQGVTPGGMRKRLLTNLKANSFALSGVDIPRLFYQLVVFVLDGSGSMSFEGTSGSSKGEEVNNGVKEVLDRLSQSKNHKSFDISMWAYAKGSKNFVAQSPLKEIPPVSLNPCKYIDDHTGSNLETTLLGVESECENYLTKYADKNSKVLVIILSDGAIHDFDESQKVCQRIKAKSNVDVSTVFFESTSGLDGMGINDISIIKTNMKELASRPDLVWTSVNPEDVRKQMIKSISLVSKID